MSEGVRHEAERTPQFDTMLQRRRPIVAVLCGQGHDRELDIGKFNTFVIGEHTAHHHGAKMHGVCELVDRSTTISNSAYASKMRLPIHQPSAEELFEVTWRLTGCKATSRE